VTDGNFQSWTSSTSAFAFAVPRVCVCTVGRESVLANQSNSYLQRQKVSDESEITTYSVVLVLHTSKLVGSLGGSHQHPVQENHTEDHPRKARKATVYGAFLVCHALVFQRCRLASHNAVIVFVFAISISFLVCMRFS
jgi:hypothetical protein